MLTFLRKFRLYCNKNTYQNKNVIKTNVIEVERRKYYIFYYEKKFHKNKNKTNIYIIVRLHCDRNDYQ